MPKLRAYGADAMLLACRETSYGVAPAHRLPRLDFKSSDLSASSRWATIRCWAAAATPRIPTAG